MTCNKCEDALIDQVEEAQSLRPLDGGDWQDDRHGLAHWAKKIGDVKTWMGPRILYRGACGAQFWRCGYDVERG